MELSENFILVLDNFQFITNPYMISSLLRFLEVAGEQIRLVILTQNVKYEPILDMIANNRINYIGKNDLEFTKEEIRMYFRECGIRLENDEVDYLEKYTE